MVIEYGCELELISGFTVGVTPLAPYYMDFIDDTYPLPAMPKRKFTNVAGDVFELSYTPPDMPPDPDDDHDGYILYMEYLSARECAAEVDALRNRARRDFLISNCVHIVEGPVSLDSSEWLEQLEGGLPGYTVPDHYGERRLVFLKSVVITTLEDWEAIRDAAVYAEITFQGVATALRSLGLKWNGKDLLDVLDGKEKSSMEHNLRMWEGEAAQVSGIPFDDHWYKIPVRAREFMVAVYVGKRWSEGLVQEEAIANAGRKGR